MRGEGGVMRGTGGLVACCLAVACTAARADDSCSSWRKVGERDGIVVEERDDGSSIREVRATGRSPLPPAAVLDTVWNHREYVGFVPYLKRLEILAEGDDWLVVYEQVAMPLVKDRDYTIRLTRLAVPGTGRSEVTFRSAPAAGPPERDDHVRVRSIEGAWVIEPEPGGGSRAVYTVRNDPGGTIPAWIVNRLQVEVAARFVGAVLARTAAKQREMRPRD
jgi:hypothetical protein